jgi:hypothetical protein
VGTYSWGERNVKHAGRLAITCLAVALLSACSGEPTAPAATSTPDPGEEAAIRGLVEQFGRSLVRVALLAPDAAKQVAEQYEPYVSPALLEAWAGDVSTAPGRVVSSPWPDRIEIRTLTRERSDRYVVTGLLVEVTSAEVASLGAAAKIPVRAVVQFSEGRWIITEYAETH